MIIIQILLIALVSAPVLGIAFYLWFILEENVRKRNQEDAVKYNIRRRRRK